MPETIVIVPYRPDNGHRDKLWAFLRDNYWSHQPFEIRVGEDNGTAPFNRSRAINQAADCEWDYAIIADADTWVPAKQLHQAMLLARIHNKLTAAFENVVELSQPCTDNILTGRITMNGSFDATRVRTRELETQSSMLVVPRKVWDMIGGFDERFQGWGAEDCAWFHACEITTGTQRVAGNAYHLWHSPARGQGWGIQYKRNMNLWNKYQRCRNLNDLRAVQCLQSA